MKSSCTIERFLLSARRVEGGYEINGTLPWVSNLGADHVFVTGCPVEGDGRLLFFVVDCKQEGFKLIDGVRFTALEGTRTLACQFRTVRIDDRRVLAHPEQGAAYLQRIQPGMILAQLGMGLGLIRDCIALIERVGRTHSHINCFEDDQAETLQAALDDAEAETFRLAALLDAGAAAPATPIGSPKCCACVWPAENLRYGPPTPPCCIRAPAAISLPPRPSAASGKPISSPS